MISIPTVGQVLEDAGGNRWRVRGVRLDHFEAEPDDQWPEGWALCIDVEPVVERVPIPESIRREFEA